MTADPRAATRDTLLKAIVEAGWWPRKRDGGGPSFLADAILATPAGSRLATTADPRAASGTVTTRLSLEVLRERLLHPVRAYTPHELAVETVAAIDDIIHGLDADAMRPVAQRDRLLEALSAAHSVIHSGERCSPRMHDLIESALAAPDAEGDFGSEYGRLLAERDRLIADGADPADLLVPDPPPLAEGGQR